MCALNISITSNVSEMFRVARRKKKENQAYSLSFKPDKDTIANAHRRIKAQPYGNIELVLELGSNLTSWSVSVC